MSSINWGAVNDPAPSAEFKSPHKSGGGGGYKNLVLPAGAVVTGECQQVSIRDLKVIKDPDTTTKVSFQFKVDPHTIIDGVDYSGQYIWGTCKPWFNNSPKCRLRLWMQALLGVEEWPEGYVPEETSEVTKQGEAIKVMHDFDNKRAKILVGNWTPAGGETRCAVDDLAPAEKFEDAVELF